MTYSEVVALRLELFLALLPGREFDVDDALKEAEKAFEFVSKRPPLSAFDRSLTPIPPAGVTAGIPDAGWKA